MSTRCNIVIKDSTDTVFLYRHMDGYPTKVLPSLRKLVALIKQRKLHASPGQAALCVLQQGIQEYARFRQGLRKRHGGDDYYKHVRGFIEPTDGIHGDVAYLYTVDVCREEILVQHHLWKEDRFSEPVKDDGGKIVNALEV